MDRLMPSRTDILARTFLWIEENLDEPLTLDRIAAHAGLSPFHFSRLFTARMGSSVMAHVRGRRLVRGARRLVDDPEIKLVDLAFDCGFESQEAFTRAFRRIFGVTPGRFRNGFAVAPLEGQYPMTTPSSRSTSAVRLPGFVTLEGFRVAGPSRRFDQTSRSDIPQLWSALIGALPFKGQVPGGVSYGVVSSVDREEGSFDYMAGVGAEPDSDLPHGFVGKHIPPATYAVFRITLNGAALHPQVRSAMATIWGELIPGEGLTLADGPDFELYESEFTPNRPGAIIDFYVPVLT